MSGRENVRAAEYLPGLPLQNPLASYPREGLMGRVITTDTLSAKYMDPRGPVFTGNESPLAYMPINTAKIYEYQKMRKQAMDNQAGGGYMQGTITQSGKSVLVRGPPKLKTLPGAGMGGGFA